MRRAVKIIWYMNSSKSSTILILTFDGGLRGRIRWIPRLHWWDWRQACLGKRGLNQVNIGIGRPILGDWIRQQPVRRSWNLLKSTNLLNPNLLGGSSTGWGGRGASCANDPCFLLDLATAASNRQFYKRCSIRLQRQRHDYTGAKPKG